VEPTGIPVRFSELRRELLVLQLAKAVLAESLDEFRRQRQPAVLTHASELFASITDGQYVHVEGNPVEDSLVVLDVHENVKSADRLSTGTAEQLYLCLRLGLARDYASRTESLPFVMDDVLVNFDPERARRVADVLLQVARTAQILLLTCRPETLEVIKIAAGRDVNVIEMERFAGAEAPAAPTRAAAATRHPTGMGGAAGLEEERRVLECLRSAGHPLGKADILGATSLPEASWGSIIHRLKEKGLVDQEGDRRGAVYRPT